jgi:CubicO group peptidase (beta-lactamase class C family)
VTRRRFLAGSCAVAAGVSAGDAVTAGSGQAADGQSTVGLDDIESRVAELLTDSLDEHDIPGAAVAVVKDGEVTMTEGYGVADRTTDRPAEATTPFRIGSISKPVVWTAIARLIRRGDLDPATPVSAYLDDDIVSWNEPVTLGNLATHTAGFEATNRGMWYDDPADVGSLSGHLDPMPAQVRSPGELGAYSNHSAALAGQVLAAVTDRPFHEAMSSLLFAPAAMGASSFRQPLPQDLSEAHATGHDAANVDGKFAGLGIAPAGALSTTANDMARFMQLHLNDGVVDGDRVLASETVDLLHRQWFTHHEALAGMTLGLIEQNYGGVRVLHHSGATRTFHSKMVLIPEWGFGLFITFNSNDAAGPREKIPEKVLEDVVPDTESDSMPADTGPTRGSELEGTYRSLSVGEHAHDSFLTNLGAVAVEVSVADDGALVLDNDGDESRWVELEPLVFRNEETGERLAFGESDGDISYLFLGGTPTALGRQPWYESASLHGVAALVALVGVASGWLLWSPSREDGESWRDWLASCRSNRSRLAKLSLWVGGNAFAVFVLSTFVYLFWDVFALLSDPSLVYRLAFVLPMVGAVASVVSGVLGVRLWLEGDWRLRTRLHYSFVAACLLFMSAFLGYWNLLLPP